MNRAKCILYGKLHVASSILLKQKLQAIAPRIAPCIALYKTALVAFLCPDNCRFHNDVIMPAAFWYYLRKKIQTALMVILKCLAIIFTFLYLTTHQICFLNYNISYPVDLRFDLPNARQFTYHCENLEWITGCFLINICFQKLLAFQIKRKIPSWPYGF